MTIHTTHPFEDPEPDPVRQFRNRLGGAVTLWTSGRSGLTVTSLMVANGEPPRLLALVDPDSDLLADLRSTGRAVVQLLAWEHRGLAEAFAGTAPAPGGPFRMAEFVETDQGPRLADAPTYAEVTLAEEGGLHVGRLTRMGIPYLEIKGKPAGSVAVVNRVDHAFTYKALPS